MDLQLKRLGGSHSLRQKQIADDLGIPVRTYGSYKRGERNLSLNDACSITDYFSIDIDELAGRRRFPTEYSDPRQASINRYFESADDSTKDKMLDAIELMAYDSKVRTETGPNL